MAYEKVTSMRLSEQVDVHGFACVDPNLHMIEWLGRGRDIRQFVVQDVESELYAQDKGAQVLSVECTGEPLYETKVKREGSSSRGVVSQFSVTLPLDIRVRASSGVVWALVVQHNYSATGLDEPGGRKLTLNFQILGQQESPANASLG